MKKTLKVPGLVFLTAVVSSSLLAGTTWHHSFVTGEGATPPFAGGVLFPLRTSFFGDQEAGYALEGFSSRPNPGDPDNPGQIQFLSRFNDAGENLWNVALEPGGAARELALVPLISAPDLFFAAYQEAPTATTRAFRLGVFQGAENTTVFSKRFETSPSEPHVIEFFDDSRMGATIDRGRTLDTIVFDRAGSTLFHKRYASPNFSGSTSLNTQTFVRRFFPDRSNYLTAVCNQSDFPAQVTLTSFLTGLAGEVISSSSFQFDAEMAEAVPFPSSLEGGGVLYRFPGIFNGVTVGGSAIPLTHLIRMNADGSLAWARTLYAGFLNKTLATPDALYLSGSRLSNIGSLPGQSDALVIQLDPATGALLNQAGFASIGEVDVVQEMIADSEHLFLTLNSGPVSSNAGPSPRSTISTLVKMDLSLKSPVGKRYLGEDAISLRPAEGALQKITRFVFSQSQDIDHEIRAVTLDANFEPLLDCLLFTPVIPDLNSAPVSLSSLNVTVAPAPVVASDLTDVVPDTSMALTSYPLVTTEICSLTEGLQIRPTEDGDGLILTFPATAGTTYRLLFSPDLASPFIEVDALTSSGGSEIFTRPLGTGKGFYRLSSSPGGE